MIQTDHIEVFGPLWVNLIHPNKDSWDRYSVTLYKGPQGSLPSDSSKEDNTDMKLSV